MAFDLPRDIVVPVDAIDVRVEAGPLPFETTYADAIERNWQTEVAANPALFDGRIIFPGELKLTAGRLEGHCHETRFATLLYWKRHRGRLSWEHAYAHAALVSRDNALVAIRMGSHTAGAGRVHFAAGSFEAEDVRDGVVDVHANMAREVREETGIAIDGLPRDPGYHLFSHEGGTVVFRRFWLDEDAETIAGRISAFVAAEPEPEIVGPVLIRDAQDLPEGIVPHMAGIVRWHFSPQGQASAHPAIEN